MSYSCKILLDSISETNKRLTTFEITFPRIVLAEFNTHRMFSRNSASSRAIPFKKQIQRVVDNPFIPEQFPIDGKGMQPNSYIDSNNPAWKYAFAAWENARLSALDAAAHLYSTLDRNYNYDAEHLKIFRDWDWQNDEKPEPAIHKQIVNRLLEPFMWHTVIITATEFSNFFKLRCDENAQYEIRRIADLMYEAYNINKDWKGNSSGELGFIAKQQKLKVGEWHCPLVSKDDFKPIMLYLSECRDLDEPNAKDWNSYSSLETESWNNGSAEVILNAYIEIKKKISVARCARVSYLTHEGKRDIKKDLELFERLRTSGHWSPFEHIAQPYFNETIHVNTSAVGQYMLRSGAIDEDCNLRCGNFIGWKQYRKEFQDENCIEFRKEN